MHKQDLLREVRHEISKIDKQWTNGYRKFDRPRDQICQFKHIFWIFLFTMLCIKIKLVPYIRYQVSAKAKRETRAHLGKWGNDWMSLSNESKCSGEQQSILILNNS